MGRMSESEGVGEHACSPWSIVGVGSALPCCPPVCRPPVCRSSWGVPLLPGVVLFLGWSSSWGEPHLPGVVLFLGWSSSLEALCPQAGAPDFAMTPLWTRGVGDACGTSWGERSLGSWTQSRA